MLVKKIRFFLSMMLFFPIMAWAGSPVDQLSALLSDFSSMQARFEQVVLGNQKNSSSKSSGSMALQRPGKFRWEVQQPNPQWLIADGQYLWIYDIDLEQVTRQKLDTHHTNSPAYLLSGSIKDLKQHFEVTRLSADDAKILGFRLKSRDHQDLFAWADIYFQNGVLKKMSLKDTLGGINIFYFTQVKINPKLPEKLFTFHVPKGVDLIKN